MPRAGMSAVQQYLDMETAMLTGRTSFSEMVGSLSLRASPRVRVILVEKTDRL